jgi:hypothetical protein
VSLLGVLEGSGVGPFSKRRLNEALGLAVTGHDGLGALTFS